MPEPVDEQNPEEMDDEYIPEMILTMMVTKVVSVLPFNAEHAVT